LELLPIFIDTANELRLTDKQLELAGLLEKQVAHSTDSER
jgi:hypothetical protein